MLNAHVKKSGKSIQVTLKGPIDEACSKTLLEVLSKLVDADVIFDMAGITTINSVGFRHWLQFLRGLAEKSTFEFVNCPAPYAEYAGLLAETAFASRIASLLVPFRCSSCGHEDVPMFEIDSVDADEGFGEIICPKCNGLMESQMDARDVVALKGE
jgi:hypothetical protein